MKSGSCWIPAFAGMRYQQDHWLKLQTIQAESAIRHVCGAKPRPSGGLGSLLRKDLIL
jgi:hypothetical protein